MLLTFINNNFIMGPAIIGLPVFVKEILKEEFNNYSKYTVKAKKLAIINSTKFSLDAMTKRFEEILDKH